MNILFSEENNILGAAKKVIISELYFGRGYLMTRSHLYECLWEWRCDHEIKQYSYGYAISQEFSIYFLL